MPTNPGPFDKRGGSADIIHASTVAHQGSAVVILGASGSGKSALALQLMALGAGLVADDRTVLSMTKGTLYADAPDTIRGRIEARGVGILNACAVGPTPVALAVALDQPETDRLPKARQKMLLGQSVPLLHAVASRHFPAALMQMLACGRYAP